MKIFLKSLRWLVCIGLIYFVINKVDYEPLLSIVGQIRIKYCFAILGVLYFQNIIKALKWHTLLLAKGIKIPLRKIIRVDWASSFLSLFVPSTISQDLFRGYGLSKKAVSKKQAASSIIVDRALSLFALIFVANLSVLLFYQTIAVREVAYASFSTLIAFVIVVFIVNRESLVRRLLRCTTLKKLKVLKKIDELRRSVNEYKLYKARLLRVFLLSVVMQMLRILVYYFGSLAINANVSYEYFMIYTPIVMLFVMLPISLAGIGLREGSFVYFFTKIGVLHATAFAIPALVSLMVVISVLPGGLVIALRGLSLKKRTTVVEESPAIT